MSRKFALCYNLLNCALTDLFAAPHTRGNHEKWNVTSHKCLYRDATKGKAHRHHRNKLDGRDNSIAYSLALNLRNGAQSTLTLLDL